MASTHYSPPERPTSILVSQVLQSHTQAFDMPVASVVVIGTPTSDRKIFHFHVSLINGSLEDRGREAIRLDMSPSDIDPNRPNRGRLFLDYLPSGLSDSPGDSVPFSIAIRGSVTAREICKYLLEDMKVDLYDFKPAGGGCRHWCATVLEHLGAAGFVDPDVGQMFKDYEEREGSKDNEEGPNFVMPRNRGTFYAEL